MRFGLTAVPGGGLISVASIPLLEKCFHFNNEMISLVLITNIVMDPIITMFNVMYNIVMSLVLKKFMIKFCPSLNKEK